MALGEHVYVSLWCQDSQTDINSGKLRHRRVLSTILCGPPIYADPTCSILLVTLDLALDDESLPDGSNDQRSPTDYHKEKERGS